MRRLMMAWALAAAGCGGAANDATGPTAPETLSLRLETPHFRLVAGTAPDAAVRDAAERLESSYARVLGALGVATLPPITVRIWQDETSYFDELTRFFGVRYQAAGYIPGPSELRVLAVPQLGTNVVHEFVHAVSLSLNPTFGNNPRWLWEAVALYENGELVDPRRLDYLVRGAFPTLQQLNADPNAGRQVYEVGYLLGEFIVSRWGRPGYLRLIRANGDLPSALGLPASEFETAWQQFVRERYF